MGYTALLRASSQGLLDVVRMCLEAGCAVDFADEVSRLLCTTPTLRPLSVQPSSVPVQRPKPKTSSLSPTLTRKRILTYFHARTPPHPHLHTHTRLHQQTFKLCCLSQKNAEGVFSFFSTCWIKIHGLMTVLFSLSLPFSLSVSLTCRWGGGRACGQKERQRPINLA